MQGISSVPPTFDDPFKDASDGARDHIINHLGSKLDRLVTIVDRDQNKVDVRAQQTVGSALTSASGLNRAVTAALKATYDPPGGLRPEGPRHDNDYVEIQDIRIAPTHQELVSDIPPFLPANFYDAPHPHPPDSMERLLDIQFRLLREELKYVFLQIRLLVSQSLTDLFLCIVPPCGHPSN